MAAELKLPEPAYYHWPRDGQLYSPSLLLGVPKGAEPLYTEAQVRALLTPKDGVGGTLKESGHE